MKIQTTRFGELDIPEDEVVTFPEGLLGFASSRRYALLDSAELEPLRWLQCVDVGHLAFVVLEPDTIREDYEVPISRECALGLKLVSPDDALILAIVTADPDPAKCTINLQAPIIINQTNRLAKQIILLGQEYAIRHPLWSASETQSVPISQDAP